MPSLSKICTTCRSVCESSSRNVYVPAAKVIPGIDTGPLNVTNVVRSGGTDCAVAAAAVSASTAHAAAIVILIRLIGIGPPSTLCVAKGVACDVPLRGQPYQLYS